MLQHTHICICNWSTMVFSDSSYEDEHVSSQNQNETDGHLEISREI